MTEKRFEWVDDPDPKSQAVTFVGINQRVLGRVWAVREAGEIRFMRSHTLPSGQPSTPLEGSSVTTVRREMVFDSLVAEIDRHREMMMAAMAVLMRGGVGSSQEALEILSGRQLQGELPLYQDFAQELAMALHDSGMESSEFPPVETEERGEGDPVKRFVTGVQRTLGEGNTMTITGPDGRSATIEGT